MADVSPDALRGVTQRVVDLYTREGFLFTALDGQAEKRELSSPDELLEILEQDFGLVFPPGTRFGPPGSLWPT